MGRILRGLASLWLAMLFFSPASAEERRKAAHLVYDRDAVMKVCRVPRPLGCTTKIVIDGKEYLLDALGAEADNVQAIIETYQSRGLTETEPGSVVGFFVTEKGHFPNPTVKFKVFKALSADFPPPPNI